MVPSWDADLAALALTMETDVAVLIAFVLAAGTTQFLAPGRRPSFGPIPSPDGRGLDRAQTAP